MDENKIVTLDNALSLKLSKSNHYIAASTSNNTRRAYQSDIRHFEEWGGVLPAKTETILAYLQAFAPTLNPRTLARRLTALKNWHTYQNFPDPTNHPSVGKTLTGIMRVHGKPRKKAHPLIPEQLHKIVLHLQQENTLAAARNNALLQIAFFGALRGSEVALRCEHISWQEQGIEILIPQSKTDQTHEGQYCAIPYGKSPLCPVMALKKWLDLSGIQEGFIFRRIYKNNILGDNPLTLLSVSNLLRKCLNEVGVRQVDHYSSHSLRRGLATAASKEGASVASIMRQGRWKNVNTVMEYVDAVNRFEENAAINILEKINR